MKYRSRLAFAISIILSGLVLSSCHMFGGKSQNKTLANLPAPTLPDTHNTVAIIDRDKIEESYQKALDSAEDPVLRQQIMVRVADLAMARSEQQQLDATDAGHYFDKPIATQVFDVPSVLDPYRSFTFCRCA